MDVTTIGPLIAAVAAGGIAAMVFYGLAPRLPSCPAWYRVALVGILATFVAIVSGWGAFRFAALHCGTYDLGVYDQVIWNTAQGRPFEISVAGPVTNYLGFHFSPALALLAPIYWIAPDARVLMAVQALGIALGALPIAWLAHERLNSRLAGLGFVLGYLLLPAVQHTARYDVHSVALAMPLLSFAAYFMLKGRYRPFAVTLGLALLCKEEIGLTVAAMGTFLCLTLRERRRWAGLALILLGLAWTLLAIRWVIPAFRGGQEYYYVSRYAYLGGSVDEILSTLFTRPLYVLEYLLIPEKLTFVLYMLLPLGLLPLIGIEVFALSWPTFGYLLLSDSPAHYSIQYQYPAPMIPFLLLGAVIGVERLAAWWARRNPGDRGARYRVVAASVGFIVVTGIVNGLYYGPPWLTKAPELAADLPRGALARQGVADIPPQAVVVAQTNLAPLVNHRRHIYTFPDVPNLSAVAYILLDREGVIYPLTNHETLFRAIERFQQNPFLEPFYQEGSFVFFRARPGNIPNPMAVNFDRAMTLLGYEVGGPSTEAGQAIPVTLYWQLPVATDARYSIYLHLLDADGERWALVDQEPGQGRYPTTDWLPGETLRETYMVAVPVGTPPGRYAPLVGLRDMTSGLPVDVVDAAGRPLGPGLTLPDVPIARPAQPPDPAALGIPHRLDRPLGDDLQLLGYALEDRPAAPGTSVALRLYWQARRDVRRDYLVVLRLRDPAGQLVGGTKGRPANGRSVTTDWRAGDVLEDRHQVLLDARLPGGDYTLTVAVADALSNRESAEVSLATVQVRGRPHIFIPPPMGHSQVVSLAATARLLGFDLAAPTVQPGQTLSLTLYWQCTAQPDTAYAVFTHLIDDRENIWGQQDNVPCRGECPTPGWLPNEILTDPHQIVVRPDTPPGTYRIAVGLYDPATGARLPRADGSGDRILLDTTIEVRRP